MLKPILPLFLLFGSAAALQCDIPGECTGEFIGFTSENSSTECLATCKDTQNCTWYTFVPEDNFCNLLLTCSEVNEDTCGSCLSGEVTCPLLCGLPGVCQGIIIHTEDASTVAECQSACTNFNGCKFYSFDPATTECLMFDTCPTVDETICPDCISGSPGCENNKDGYFMMVIGGDDGRKLDDVELVSLDPISQPVPECLTELNPLPVTVYEAAGGLDYSDEGVPFYCGGYSGGYTDKCYKYEASVDAWDISGTMAVDRFNSGYGSSESWGLVMAGGRNGNYISSVETTDDGQVLGSLPDLPQENYYSCLVIVDDDIIFTCGGSLSPTSTLIFSKKTNLWSSMTPMPTQRENHSCGLVTNPDQGAEIVTAGGYYNDRLYSVDIYTINTDSWRAANSLPKTIYAAAAVPYQNSFLLVGGYNGDAGQYIGDIYQYNAEEDEWDELESKLKTPRDGHVALLVKESLFPECS